jgi:hypothetical protein
MTDGSCSLPSFRYPIQETEKSGLLTINLSVIFAMIAVLFTFTPAYAQGPVGDGQLKVHVTPKQAYVFVDGQAIRDGSQTISLLAGDHQVGVYNYGYLPKTQTVHIVAGDTSNVYFALKPSGAPVSGPFGYIEFKGPGRAAVLLNGTTPDYFVGHVDEFDWDWIWHQRLLVQPGTYQVMVTRKGQTIWSGPVSVKADEKVVVDLNHHGAEKTEDWSTGSELGTLPRFRAGMASATVPVAPVTAELAAQRANIACGESTALDWKSTDAADTSISGVGSVPHSGERTVRPMRTVSYQFTAKGPGGVVTKTVTVDVDTQPTANISLSQSVVHFHKIGDKVVADEPATLQWSTYNANQVTISHLGSVSASGSRSVTADPERSSIGPVDVEVPYELTTTNACGGTATRRAMLHVVGSIDPAPPVKLASVFYPTAYPTAKHPQLGLLASEEKMLAQAADRFKTHEEYEGQAHLLVVGHADMRGSMKYNLRLSERRARLAKGFLVAHGVSADKIEVRAEGKTKELSRSQVVSLQSQDKAKPEKWMAHQTRATWLAYNRRVDIILEPSGTQSAKAYPNDATDARVLWQPAEPSLHAVQAAARLPGNASMASSAGSGQ